LASFYNLRIYFPNLHFNIIFECKPRSPKCAEVFQNKNLCITLFHSSWQCQPIVWREELKLRSSLCIRLTTADVIYIGLFLFHTTDQRVAFRFSGHSLVSWSTVNEFVLLIPAGQILTRKLTTAIWITKITSWKVECNVIQQRTVMILVSFFLRTVFAETGWWASVRLLVARQKNERVRCGIGFGALLAVRNVD